MESVISFIIGVLTGATIVYFAQYKQRVVCVLHGVASYVERQQTEKQTRKDRILEILKEKSTITNDDIQKPLGISHPTAALYLHELVEEGKIEQLGERGRFVSYRLKK